MTHSEHWPALRQGMCGAMSDYDHGSTGSGSLGSSGSSSSIGSSSVSVISGSSTSIDAESASDASGESGCGDDDIATRVMALTAKLFVGAEHVQRAELMVSVVDHLNVVAGRFARGRVYRSVIVARTVNGIPNRRLAVLMAMRAYRMLSEMQLQISRGFVYLGTPQLTDLFQAVMRHLTRRHGDGAPGGAW
jgi:hypothetical protein